MGSVIEINDTLQITTQQGFPQELVLQTHLITPFKAESFQNKVFEFKDKPDLRIYHPAPTRVFLVHNINGKWLHWGHVHIIEQTINSQTQTTSGKFKIMKLYTPQEMRIINLADSPEGKHYWDDSLHKLP